VRPTDQTKKSFAAAVSADRLGQNQTRKPNNRQPIMVGTRRSPVVSGSAPSNMSAAKPLLGKAFFCVDNVNVVMTETEMESFVKRLKVRVLSCHESNPRRTFHERRQKIKPKDRKAFRLCINKADTDLLMNPDNWPADIAISAWYFKPKKTDEPAAAEEATAAEAADEASEMLTAELSVEADVAAAEAEIVQPEVQPEAEYFDDANMTLSPIAVAVANAGGDLTVLYDQTEGDTDPNNHG
jgi:hypothetical protein